MSKEFDDYIADKPGLNLIPKEDVSLIKIKMGKSHRNKKDWETIKEILVSRDILTAEPMRKNRKVASFEHILCEEGALVVFTNIDDCQRHIKDLNKSGRNASRYFQIQSLSFESVIGIADENLMDVYIDIQNELNCKCMAYFSREKQLKVVILEKR